MRPFLLPLHRRAVMTPDNVAVVRIKPANYPHARAFDEIVESLAEGLQQMGCQVSSRENTLIPDIPNILIGAHLLADAQLAALPSNVVLYNFEQLHRESTWTREAYLKALANRPYWDYSQYNISAIKRLYPLATAEFVPVGYASCLTRLEPALEDIDVLFYGSVNERRNRVFEQLRRKGIKLHTAFGVYGRERDELIRRAKIILNLHYYESHILEVVRVSYPMANRKAVVCEYGSDTEMHPALSEGLCLSRYEALADSCLGLLANNAARSELGARALGAIRSIPYSDILRSTSCFNC